jgi:LAO/AO transport system kinase
MLLPGVDRKRLFAGDRRTIARAISLIENETLDAEELVSEVFARAGKAFRIGITGPPGAGKSTLANKLALHFSREGTRVGIIAVDPTSPFTGGALLGDRVRMTDVELDERVFIRSMASRGSLGGLSKRAIEAADVLDAAGMEIVIMETVGVGQSELDIARAVDTTIVVLVPESGDQIQAMKAGLMEIADFFVVNKADRAGADQAVQALQTILRFRPSEGWDPPVLRTVAHEGRGIDDVVAAVAGHRNYLQTGGRLDVARRSRLESRIVRYVDSHLARVFWNTDRQALLRDRLSALERGTAALMQILHELIRDFREKEG